MSNKIPNRFGKTYVGLTVTRLNIWAAKAFYGSESLNTDCDRGAVEFGSILPLDFGLTFAVDDCCVVTTVTS